MEPIRIFIDTNVIIDYFSGRMHDGEALKIMQLGRTPQYELCTTILSAINTVYARKYFNSDFKPSDIERVVTVIPHTLDAWKQAQKVPMDDFEDCIQTVEAIKSGCAAIISRDRHFKDCPLKVFSPKEFLELVTSEN